MKGVLASLLASQRSTQLVRPSQLDIQYHRSKQTRCNELPPLPELAVPAVRVLCERLCETALQAFFPRFPVRHHPREKIKELRTMVKVLTMAEFVGDYVVYFLHRRLN
jgi:hypothetical protein